MNEPKTPNNSRDWASINIFLFCNGQQCSPPRKYHLQTEDLMWWNATKNFLAHSQFGSMHSNIELYTLDGKKVESPLELKNSAAYVAVEPPDSFISAGYVEYLIKASRSWEKRQEKLSNLVDEDKGDLDMPFDLIDKEKVQGIVTLNQITENSLGKNLNQSQNKLDKPIITKKGSNSRYKPYQKCKSIKDGTEKNVMRKKDISGSSKLNDQTFKKKNLPFVKSFKIKNNKQLIASAKTSNSSNKPTAKEIDNKVPLNGQNFDNFKTSIILNEFEKKAQALNNVNESVGKNTTDLEAINTVDRITTIVDNSKILLELSKENLKDESVNPYTSAADNTLYQEAVQNIERKLNIKLKIKLDDLLITSPENGRVVEQKTSFVTLITKEKASQVNIDVILSKDIFGINNYLINKENDEREYISCNDHRNDTLIDVACDSFSPKSNILNRLYSHVGSNDLVFLSNAITASPAECCTCIQVGTQTDEKGIQTSSSYIKTVINSTNNTCEKSRYNITAGDKIDKKEPYSNPQVNQDDNKAVINNSLISTRTLIDAYVQTEWCNILVSLKNKLFHSIW